jgi:hypothetical protein
VLLEYWNICWDIFLEILCMKILFCLCVGLIFYALWIAALLIFLFGIHLTAVLNTTLCLELIGSNGIFGDISDWFFRNTTSSGSQHSDWQMHPLENWLLLKSDVQFPKVLGFDTWKISVPLFRATCRLFSILLLLWILESFYVCGYYYSVYPCTSETLRGSNCCVVFLITLFYPLSLWEKKGE